MTGRIPRAYVVVYLVALLLPLGICTFYALRNAQRHKEYPQSADRFGYLEMAADMRRGSAPQGLLRFTVDSPHSRLLLDHFRPQHEPLNDNAFVGPPAYHYVAATDLIICQYPPGVPRMLSLFPPGRAVFTWQVAAAAALVLVAVWGCIMALWKPESRRLAAAGVTAVFAQTVVMMEGMTVSYSIDLLILPLLAAVMAAMIVARKPGQSGLAGILLGLGAGLALGWGVVIRVSTALLLPGFVAALWPQRSKELWRLNGGPLWAMLTGFAVGALPLGLHQQALTGSMFRSTYAATDTAFSTQVVADNAAYYFAGDGNDRFFLLALGRWRSGSRSWYSGDPSDTCYGEVWRLYSCGGWSPTAYFLTHPITTPYYQLPTVLVCLAGMAITLILEPAANATETPIQTPANDPVRKQRTEQTTGDPDQASTWRGTSCELAASVVCVLAVIWQAASLSELPPDNRYQMPDVSLPDSLRDPKAWIVGERLAGTLWYYHGIYAHPLTAIDARQRAAFFEFVRNRGEPLYFIDDTDYLGKQIVNELRGAALTPAGKFAESAVYRVDWSQ